MIHIFGTSGFAREVRDIVTALGGESVFVARSQEEAGRWAGPERIIVEDDVPAGADCAIGIGDNATRSKIAARFAGRCRFATLIHPSATFGSRQRDKVEQARGVIICAGVRFTNNIAIGDFAIVNLNATVGHDVSIGAFANIAPGANLSGYVNVGHYVWVGTNAAINQGTEDEPLTIGEGAVIGSGAVVVDHCEPQKTYVGIPARAR